MVALAMCRPRQSPCTLTVSVMRAVAGEGLGRMHEVENLHAGQESAAMDKFYAWATTGDTKAPRVAPRTDAEYDRRAQARMRAA